MLHLLCQLFDIGTVPSTNKYELSVINLQRGITANMLQTQVNALW